MEKNIVARKNKNSHNSNHTPDPFEGQQEQDDLLLEGTDSQPLADIHRLTHTITSSAFEHEDERHEAGKRDVELYIRTYNTLLRSSGEISLKALVQAHYNIDSSLHPEFAFPLSRYVRAHL